MIRRFGTAAAKFAFIIVATGIGVNFAITIALERKGDIAAILSALEPRDVLFVDEVHRLPRAIEELLYPAMEDGAIDIVIGPRAQRCFNV